MSMVHNNKPERRKKQQAQSPEWETNAAISAIMGIAMTPLNFVAQLKEILNALVAISWLKVEKKGAIFVINNQKELILLAEHSLHSQLKKSCAKVAMNQCLCGKAAAAKKILFCSNMDHNHETRFEGMEDHGHYCIPLQNNQSNVIGLIVLYLQAGHIPHSNEKQLMEMLGQAISSIVVNRSLQLKAEISQIRLQHAQQDILHKLVSASEFKDNDTGEHIKRVGLYSAVIGKQLGLSEKQVKILKQAAPLHDIGKIGISDKILLKPDKLDAEEWKTMQQHTKIGANLLTGEHPLLKASQEIALTHHEKWDGSGYPQGLKGEEIPLFGRICALADVFDALTNKRPYKKAWPLKDALAELDRGDGTHFDPQVLKAFKSQLPKILEIKMIYSNDMGSHELGSLSHLQMHKVNSWDSSISVGIDHIDTQHMYLLELIEQARKSTKQFKTKMIVKTLLDMKSYAKVHFADEERSMLKYDYPKRKEHARMHQAFINKTENFLDGLEASPLAISSEITGYLAHWLKTHTKLQDADYGEFIKKQAKN